ncbi:MAG TPA: LamG-like jellyroll fold domain-containing protein [Planctomycetota bacterium]
MVTRFVMLVVCACLAGAVPQAAGGLVAYWSLDTLSAGTTPDGSGAAHTATLVGSPTAGAGAFGNALTFDGGTDYLRASDAPDLDFGTSSFSVAAFVRPAGATADRLVNKWASTTEPGWLFDINEAVGGGAMADRIRVRMRDAAGADVDFSVAATLGVNTWRHVAAVVDRTADILRLYLDGTQVGGDLNIAALGGSVSNAAQVGIGTIVAATGNFFDGGIDEVRLYNRALSAAEVGVLVLGVPGPTGLMPVPGAGSIELFWPPVAGAADYTVYQGTTAIATVAGTSYLVTGLTQGVSYSFTVVANTSVGASRPSPIATAVPLPPPPRTEGHSEGLLEENCACGSTIPDGGPGGLPAWLALLAALVTRAAGRRSKE